VPTPARYDDGYSTGYSAGYTDAFDRAQYLLTEGWGDDYYCNEYY
jgi:hypothetical protein